MFESDYADALLLEEGDESAFAPEAENEVEKKIPINAKSGLRLNALYAQYAADPNEANLNDLLKDLRNYARRILIGAGFGLRLDITETVQLGVIKVWQNLTKFRGTSKFSSWAHRVIKNTALDEIRKLDRRKEVELPDGDEGDVLAYYAAASGSHCYQGSSGGAEDHDDGEGVATDRRHIISKPPLHARDEGDFEIVKSVRIEASLALAEKVLNAKDFELLGYYLEGYSPDSIGVYFQRDAKWASNQLTRIKNKLKKATQAKGEERAS